MASKKAQNKLQNWKSDTVLAIKYFLNSWFFVPLTMLFIWMEMRILALNVAVDEDWRLASTLSHQMELLTENRRHRPCRVSRLSRSLVHH